MLTDLHRGSDIFTDNPKQKQNLFSEGDFSTNQDQTNKREVALSYEDIGYAPPPN